MDLFLEIQLVRYDSIDLGKTDLWIQAELFEHYQLIEHIFVQNQDRVFLILYFGPEHLVEYFALDQQRKDDNLIVCFMCMRKIFSLLSDLSINRSKLTYLLCQVSFICFPFLNNSRFYILRLFNLIDFL